MGNFDGGHRQTAIAHICVDAVKGSGQEADHRSAACGFSSRRSVSRKNRAVRTRSTSSLTRRDDRILNICRPLCDAKPRPVVMRLPDHVLDRLTKMVRRISRCEGISQRASALLVEHPCVTMRSSRDATCLVGLRPSYAEIPEVR
jgi:hypothetical protein